MEDVDFWVPEGMDEEELKMKIRIEKELGLPYDISIVRLYQAAIWKALSDVVGINRYRRLKKAAAQDDYYRKLRYLGFFT